MAHPSIEISPAGQRVALIAHRAAFWAERATLLVADLHLGKGETLAAGGVPVPRALVESDLRRLAHAVAFTGATRVLILGDLLHAPIGLVPAMIEHVAAWRRSIDAEIAIVPGNHDRRLARVVEPWGLTVLDSIHQEGPFVFVHDPDHAPPDAGFAWSGHIHPRVSLRAGGDSLSLACFLVGEQRAVLPAFSAFTAGVSVLPAPGDRIWGVADHCVVEVPGAAFRERARR